MSFSINYNAIRSRIKEVSSIDSETVHFIKQKRTDCPECVFDPINQESSNPFCPSCDGVGFISVEIKTPIVASVDRATGLEHIYQPGGRLQKGSVIMTVHESQLVSAGYSLDADWVNEIDWVEIARQKYRLAEGDSVIPQTLQGDVYEIIFHLSVMTQ